MIEETNLNIGFYITTVMFVALNIYIIFNSFYFKKWYLQGSIG